MNISVQAANLSPNRIESKLFLPELECSSSEANCHTRTICSKFVTVLHQVVGYYVTREGVCKLWDSLTCRRPTNRSVSGRVQLLYRLCVTITPRSLHLMTRKLISQYRLLTSIKDVKIRRRCQITSTKAEKCCRTPTPFTELTLTQQTVATTSRVQQIQNNSK